MRKPHEEVHSINSLALILGIGRERLTHALNDAGEKASEPITVARAFAALERKLARELDRARKQKAEADGAEMDAAEKKGILMKRADCDFLVSELAVQTLRIIRTADYLPIEGRKRCAKDLEGIEVNLNGKNNS
jgi:phage terminase Nu1 subunit (DNA packaging protein)